MADLLRISVVQADLHWEDTTANLHRCNDLLSPIPAGSTDLIILPEMFTTGFSMNAAELAEPMDGPTLHWLQQQAQAKRTAITGSFICSHEGHFFNRLLFVRPDGEYIHYDKKHLFTLAGEHKIYQPGTTLVHVEWHGWTIRPLVCYDLRFPVWSRNTDHYDLLLYVANWPDQRRHAWMNLLAARAIENQAYCVGVNRVGIDGNGHHYSGDTSVYDYSGRLLTQLTDQETVVTLSLDKEKQQAFRQKLDFLADRDTFTLA